MKQATTIFSSVIGFDPSSDIPLYRQIYESIRDAVLSGRLSPGARLPSTRGLALELGISRITVVNAFDHLYAEGYVESFTGSGTYVARDLPDDLLNAKNETPDNNDADADNLLASRKRRELSKRGTALWPIRMAVTERCDHQRPFAPGLPALDIFPRQTWARLVGRQWRRPGCNLLNYGDPAGYWPLREAIAAYLGTARAVRCSPEQVIVTAGTQQGVDLASKILLDPGDTVWTEEYGYLAARAALLGAGARAVPVPVDEEGLVVSAGVSRAPHARLAHVAPSYQYPLGVTMSLARRLALLDWAERAGAWILEDDYDSEFRYAGRPLSALQGLDRNGRVIYLGTFSKTLFPSLRLGYLVAPPDMVDHFVKARAVAGWCSPGVDQAVAADFITEGHFGRHIRQMRTVYAERQLALVEAAGRELSHLLEVEPRPAGMHLVGWLPKGVDDQVVAREAHKYGIEVQPLSMFAARKNNQWRGGLVLGYGSYDVRKIRGGVRKLGMAIKDAMKNGVVGS